jgi:hypothetical protein
VRQEMVRAHPDSRIGGMQEAAAGAVAELVSALDQQMMLVSGPLSCEVY